MSQSNQQLEESTLIRNFGIGKKLTDIEIMQVLSALQTKDTKRLKKIFGKPQNFKNRTIIAYAKNVKQYVDRLDNPTPQIEQFAQRKYGVNLTNSLETNLIVMGNRKRNIVVTHPPTQSVVEQIIKPPNSRYKENNRFAQWEILNPNVVDLNSTLTYCNFTNQEIRTLRANDVEKMRLFMILVFSNGNKQIVSTELLNLDDFVAIDLFIQAYNVGQIVNQDQTRIYTYDKFDFQSGIIQQNVVSQIESIFCRFYKRGY